MLVSLSVGILLKLSFFAGLRQLPLDSVKFCLSLLIASKSHLISFFFLTESKLFLSIGFVVIENLHDG